MALIFHHASSAKRPETLWQQRDLIVGSDPAPQRRQKQVM